MDGGSLYNRIHKGESKLDWSTKLQMLSDIALGIAYLHKKNLIHRDLKSQNILLSKEMVAKVADFGLAKFTDTNKSFLHTQAAGTALWMAPEVTLGESYGSSCDVFSYAIIMFEILTERIPYSHFKKIADLSIKVAMEPDFRPQLPGEDERASLSTSENLGEEGYAVYINMMTKGWKAEKEERPSIGEILKEIEKIIEMQKKNARKSRKSLRKSIK